MEAVENNHGKNNWSEVSNGRIYLKNKQLLYEVIENRCENSKVRVEDLFLLCPSPRNSRTGAYEKGSDDVLTPYGKLKVFFVGPLQRPWLLHRAKFNYPKI